jgi:hypothetical protein
MSRVFYLVPIGGEYCDFCAASQVFKLYPCSNFGWLDVRYLPASQATGPLERSAPNWWTDVTGTG